jgi:hypothetical protein
MNTAPYYRANPLLLTILFLVAAALAGCSDTGKNDNPLSKILSQLDPAYSESARTQAIKSLRLLGTNAFPSLVAEMNAFKWHTPEEKDEKVISRMRRLRAAFEVFGTNLAPLTGEFVANLNTNRNFMGALNGLAAMREGGAKYLVEAMTNNDAPIRLNAVAGIMQIGTNASVAKLAFPNLVLLLKDDSPLTRCLAVKTIGAYCFEPNTCIPVLLECAQADPDLVVRSQSVKGVGRIRVRFGQLDAKTISTLVDISKNDKSQVVRSCAARVLAGTEP